MIKHSIYKFTIALQYINEMLTHALTSITAIISYRLQRNMFRFTACIIRIHKRNGMDALCIGDANQCVLCVNGTHP